MWLVKNVINCLNWLFLLMMLNLIHSVVLHLCCFLSVLLLLHCLTSLKFNLPLERQVH